MSREGNLEDRGYGVHPHELLREAERVIDHQVRSIERSDSKSAELLRLGVAALAGGLALAALTAQYAPRAANTLVLFLFGAGGVFNLISLLFFLSAYTGFKRHPESHTGPRLSWLVTKANLPGWTLPEHVLSLLVALNSFEEHNVLELIRSADWRRRGLYALGIALVSYAGSTFFILGGP